MEAETMWVFSTGMLSIVADRNSADHLHIRGRIKGDIERVFPSADVRYTPDADYYWRASIKREDVARALAEEVMRVDYCNYKDSLAEHWRHDAYVDVWERLRTLQVERR